MCLADLGFEEWSTITTITLSVVAIVVAICSSRSTSKAAERQIAEAEDDGEPFDEKVARITGELSTLFSRSHELEEEIRKQLGGIGIEI
jgi:glucose uptake protein GlcU